jgi:hypothetical protein
MASSSDEVTVIDSVDISQATTASPSTHSSGQVVSRNESKVWTWVVREPEGGGSMQALLSTSANAKCFELAATLDC